MPAAADIRTRGDRERILGDYVTWGRTVAAQLDELVRLIGTFNRQEGGGAPPKK